MMFDKDNTSFNGDSLCKSCKWGAPVYIGVHRTVAKLTCLCVLDEKEYTKVGVCKNYEEVRNEDPNK